MYITICDDEKACQDSVKNLLQQFMAGKNVSYKTKAFGNGESLVGTCEANESFVRKQDTVGDGGIAALLMDGEDVTVKRFYHTKDCFCSHAQSLKSGA